MDEESTVRPAGEPLSVDSRLAKIEAAQQIFKEIADTSASNLYKDELAEAREKGPGEYTRLLRDVVIPRRETALNRVNGEAGEFLERARRKAEAGIALLIAREARAKGIISAEEMFLAEQDCRDVVEEVPPRSEIKQEETQASSIQEVRVASDEIPRERLNALKLLLREGGKPSFEEVQGVIGKTKEGKRPAGQFTFTMVANSLRGNTMKLFRRVSRNKATDEESEVWEGIKSRELAESGEANLSDYKIMAAFMRRLTGWINEHNPRGEVEQNGEEEKKELSSREKEVIASALRSHDGFKIISVGKQYPFSLSIEAMVAVDKILGEARQNDAQNVPDETPADFIEAERATALSHAKAILLSGNLENLDLDARELLLEIEDQQRKLPANINVFPFLANGSSEIAVLRDKQLNVTSISKVWYAPEVA